MIRAVSCPYFRRALGWCVPIGGLGGLIGLGGGEFRLPVLMYGIGFNARAAVPLNLLTFAKVHDRMHPRMSAIVDLISKQ